jgi:dihydrofolate synthase / folylpolyglutamate synthase
VQAETILGERFICDTTMDYSETIQWLYTQLPMFQRIGPAAYKADLKNILALCGLLGNPQNQYSSIHIAGTNGKGSVAHMTASILQEAGFKTGLFTSPHLVDFRERIRINGFMIPKKSVTEFVASVRTQCQDIHPSFFELTTAMAFDHFAKEQIDIAVIEIGMGGRLDSTNIITPLVSVITNIGLDHQQFLGSTLPEIAGEKAGIIKPGVPVVVGETQEAISSVFVDKAREHQAPIWFADQMPPEKLLIPETNDETDKPIAEKPIQGFGGTYQKRNRQTVAGTIRVLTMNGMGISTRNYYQGIRKVVSNTGIRGRWEILNNNPLTICDVGHNEAGIREVVEQIKGTTHKQLHFVFGTVGDKNPDNILALLPREARYYFCKADIPRGMDASLLAEEARKAGLDGAVYPSVKAAYMAAQQQASTEDLIFIGGSTFVVSEIVDE